jgi:methylenetetrahydrofolate reductase (NADPH)
MTATPSTRRLPISIEFFPPKTPEGVVKLRAARGGVDASGLQVCWVN